jgi:two-component system, LytTR family, sensor kinase
MKSKVLTILIHVITWVIFFSLPFIFLPSPFNAIYSLKTQYFHFLKILTSDIFLIFIFYFNSNILITKLLVQKRYFLYGITTISLFILFIIYGDIVFRSSIQYPSLDEPGFFNSGHLHSIYLFLIIFFVSGGIKMMQQWKQTDRQNKMIEAERMQTELSFLHSQINPHFLFNTLNSIYSLALMRSELTADAVMKLSSLMRYILQEVQREKVPLEMEIQCIQNYVELQKIRLNPNVDLQLVITGDFIPYQIPPLILIPFIENAFKYGTSTHETTAITIEAEINQGVFHLKTTNKIFVMREKNESFGIGFRNSERRLRLVYPDKHKISIVNNSEMYILDLKIEMA